ncbi:Acyl-coenzyme a oxidase [Thalictrum thalictroides]|uniref:Acyl-coenzyme a oxidase n=1 Tax=Thalictrum thalictroides TaxID=46969 RepID=A0A7J6VXA5_THATH|nr:Acyl-coenzyme a oxidase [Thalictrum thalictroides]
MGYCLVRTDKKDDVARFLVKTVAQLGSGKKLVGTTSYMGRIEHLIQCRCDVQRAEDCSKPSVILEAFETRVARMNVACARNVSKMPNPEEGFSELSSDLVEAAVAHCQLIVVSNAWSGIIKAYPKATVVLVRNHGIYVWGESWISAKTQAECYHYLFDAAIKLYQLGLDWSTPSHGPIGHAQKLLDADSDTSSIVKENIKQEKIKEAEELEEGEGVDETREHKAGGGVAGTGEDKVGVVEKAKDSG